MEYAREVAATQRTVAATFDRINALAKVSEAQLLSMSVATQLLSVKARTTATQQSTAQGVVRLRESEEAAALTRSTKASGIFIVWERFTTGTIDKYCWYLRTRRLVGLQWRIGLAILSGATGGATTALLCRLR